MSTAGAGFYLLRFAQALRTPLDLGQAKLLDEQGQEIRDAFLDLPLPSADGKRVSLLLHPGRVKSGVGANLALGRALHAGSTVSLVVEHPSLTHPLVKSWVVTAFDAQAPQPERWRVDVPRKASREPLVVHLDSAISSSGESLIAVRDPQGRRLAGSTRLESGETVWRFTPSRPWRAGRYAVVAHPDLEDPAGNRACAAFELVRASQVRCDAGSTVPFSVSGPSR